MSLDVSNLYRWTMSQKLPVNGFKWVKKLSKFDKHFINDYDEISNKGYFLEVDVEYTKIYSMELHSTELRSIFIWICLKETKLKTFNKLVCSINDKENCCANKSFKISIKSWINTKKSTQSNSI